MNESLIIKIILGAVAFFVSLQILYFLFIKSNNQTNHDGSSSNKDKSSAESYLPIETDENENIASTINQSDSSSNSNSTVNKKSKNSFSGVKLFILLISFFALIVIAVSLGSIAFYKSSEDKNVKQKESLIAELKRDLNKYENTNQNVYKNDENKNINNNINGNLNSNPSKIVQSNKFLVYSPDDIKTKLSDLSGLKDQKADIADIISYLKNPKYFTRLGAKPPKGLIMYGPPGTGKTLLAKAMAGEAGITFIATSGSNFDEKWIGTGAANVRELFKLARSNKPCIIFIDEIDALAPNRENVGEQSGRAQTINQLLAELDGFSNDLSSGIFLVAATNRLTSIDSALLRPGRLDRQVEFKLPNLDERTDLIKYYISQIKASNNLDINMLAVKTAGYSPADIASLANEAAIFATKKDKSSVDLESFEFALKKLKGTQQNLISREIAVDFVSPDQVNTKFSDVAGLKGPKDEIKDIISFLKNSKDFVKLGAKPPKGLLLYGPPGTGKTLLARALAGESNVGFLSISGSSFDERYVGVGASRVRELFKIARERSPCILFIDEIDALLPQRSDGSDYTGRLQTINQFLTELDGVLNSKNSGIFVVGATNQLSLMDKASLRPGRFDRKVEIKLPTRQEREDIIKLHLKNVVSDKKLDIKRIATITSGYSGADIKNLINEAAIYATKENKKQVDMSSIENANDKIMLGLKFDHGTVNEKERKITAYHEAGHALVGLMIKDSDYKVDKITIVSRGHAVGVTYSHTEHDQVFQSKKTLEDLIAKALGGRLAEEIIFGKDYVTTGASSDLQTANDIANQMVTKFGMSNLGLVYINNNKVYDNDTIAKEISTIITRNEERARKIIKDNMDKLHALANALLEHETLYEKDILRILKLSPAQKK